MSVALPVDHDTVPASPGRVPRDLTHGVGEVGHQCGGAGAGAQWTREHAARGVERDFFCACIFRAIGWIGDAICHVFAHNRRGKFNMESVRQPVDMVVLWWGGRASEASTGGCQRPSEDRVQNNIVLSCTIHIALYAQNTHA